jgi:hypothetical protein
MNIRSVTYELLDQDRQADRRTDTTKLIAAVNNFAKAPKKRVFCNCFEEVLVFRVLILRINLVLLNPPILLS